MSPFGSLTRKMHCGMHLGLSYPSSKVILLFSGNTLLVGTGWLTLVTGHTFLSSMQVHIRGGSFKQPEFD